MKKRTLTLFLSLALCASLFIPALAVSDVTITKNNDGTPAVGSGYIIPGVTETRTYEAYNKEPMMGEDWKYGLDPNNITVYTIPVGTRIDTSGAIPFFMSHSLELVDGKLDQFYPEDWMDRMTESATYQAALDADIEVLPAGSYVQFEKEGFYAFTFAYGDWTYYAPSVVHVVASTTPVAPTEPEQPAVPTVAPSPCKGSIDGMMLTLNAYLFTEGNAGSNYVMLRDVAQLLNGTKAQFEVTWDKEKGIVITTGKAYTPVGGELQGKGDGSKPYTANASTITIDGRTVELSAYTIEGNNYFKLRDLGAALGFNVSWDKDAGVIIDSNAPYSSTN